MRKRYIAVNRRDFKIWIDQDNSKTVSAKYSHDGCLIEVDLWGFLIPADAFEEMVGEIYQWDKK